MPEPDSVDTTISLATGGITTSPVSAEQVDHLRRLLSTEPVWNHGRSTSLGRPTRRSQRLPVDPAEQASYDEWKLRYDRLVERGREKRWLGFHDVDINPPLGEWEYTETEEEYNHRLAEWQNHGPQVEVRMGSVDSGSVWTTAQYRALPLATGRYVMDGMDVTIS